MTAKDVHNSGLMIWHPKLKWTILERKKYIYWENKLFRGNNVISLKSRQLISITWGQRETTLTKEDTKQYYFKSLTRSMQKWTNSKKIQVGNALIMEYVFDLCIENNPWERRIEHESLNTLGWEQEGFIFGHYIANKH